MLNQHKILRVLQLISLLQKKPSKSIKFLANLLETTERTVYRYLDLVKELGFELHRDHNNRFYISSENEDEHIAFTKDEALLLRELILTSGSKSKLKDTLLRKLYFNSEIAIQSNHVLKAHLGKIVEQLRNAIQLKKRVILKNYHSVNSQNISDRLVEPIMFTDNYNCLIAFELESKENKYFNIERITKVETLDAVQTFEYLHKYDKPDIFGFSELNGEKFDIELRLSLRAYLILKEEYPLVEPYVKKEVNKATYLLKCTVNNPKAITRFVLGLPEDVQIVGSENYKLYMTKYS